MRTLEAVPEKRIRAKAYGWVNSLSRYNRRMSLNQAVPLFG